MEVCNCWLVLDKHGSDVMLTRITPAELVLLVKDRRDLVGKHPIHDLEITGTIKRSHSVEKERLKAIYGGDPKDRSRTKVEVAYPGEANNLPETFKETGLLEQSVVKLQQVVVPAPDDVPEEEIVPIVTPIPTKASPATVASK